MAGEIEVNVNQNNNQVNLTQNVTNTVEVKSLGPKGDKGDKGETGATGPVYEPTGSLFITGSINISGSINLVSGSLNVEGMTYPTTDGDRGDILTTDGSGNITFDRTRIYAQIKNISGTTLQKGTPVHVVSSVGNLDEVIAASASNPSTMPATFVLSETLVDDQEGLGILTGFINGVNTSAFGEGDVVYVGANGGYTNQKPSGSNLIQNLGIVTKVSENGSGFIYGSGRTNDTPNLLQGNIFFGSASNQQYQTHLSSAIDLTTLNNITASGNISSSGTVYGVTGSFSHLVGNSPITIGSPVTFTQAITGSVFSGSFVGDASGLSGISGGGSGIFNLTGSVYATTNDLQITGSLIVDNGGSDTFIVDGSGSTIFEIRGSEGTLFQITDSLSGSLFSVSDISGFPQFEVFSDGQILFGWSPQSLYTTAKIESTTAATTQSIYSISTSSYDGAFFEYTVTSASNMRAGTISAIWEAGGTNINYSDVSTLDIGSTSGVDLLVNISQSKAHLQSITDTSSWKIKTIIRSI